MDLLKHSASILSPSARGRPKPRMAASSVRSTQNLVLKNRLSAFGHPKPNGARRFSARRRSTPQRKIAASTVILPGAFFRLGLGALRLRFLCAQKHGRRARRAPAPPPLRGSGQDARIGGRDLRSRSIPSKSCFQGWRSQGPAWTGPRRYLRCAKKHAAVVARVEPVKERGARSADVQVAGGRGRETELECQPWVPPLSAAFKPLGRNHSCKFKHSIVSEFGLEGKRRNPCRGKIYPC